MGLMQAWDTYNKIFGIAFKHKAATFALAFLLLGLCVLPIAKIEKSIVPKAGNDILTIDVSTHKANDIDETERIVNEIQNILDEQPESQYYISGVGLGLPRYDFSVQPKSTSSTVGDIFVRIDLNKGGRFKDMGSFVDYMQEELEEFKIKSSVSGLKYHVGQFSDITLIAQPKTITKIYGRRGRIAGCYCSSRVSCIEIQNQLKEALAQRDDIPDSIELEFEGEAKNFFDMLESITGAALVSIFLMFMILLIQFGSLKQVLMV